MKRALLARDVGSKELLGTDVDVEVRPSEKADKLLSKSLFWVLRRGEEREEESRREEEVDERMVG